MFLLHDYLHIFHVVVHLILLNQLSNLTISLSSFIGSIKCCYVSLNPNEVGMTYPCDEHLADIS